MRGILRTHKQPWKVNYFALSCQVTVHTCAHLQHSAFVTCVSVNELHHLVLFTLRSALTLQLLGEWSQRSKSKRERPAKPPDSHVDTPVQVRRCLGMQPTMQAHSAPADCVSRDVSDLWHSANRPSLIYIALLAPRPTPVPANIRQRAPRAEPAPPLQPTSRIFYQRFNSLATSPPSYYHWSPVGRFKELFSSS